MKKIRNVLFYIGIIGAFSGLIVWSMHRGIKLEIGRNISLPKGGKTLLHEFVTEFINNLQHPLALLLVQIVTIILAARLMGWICQKIGQPSVVGEIIAGIVLGPSLLGLYFPQAFHSLFPAQSLGNLQFLSQIGLILFMFVVGMELDLKVLKNRAHDAVVISHASIVIPFGLGIGLAYFLYGKFAPPTIPFSSFALFIGISMSITAFPVLARIVQERGIHKTRLGALVITCAAADDITAWCILAAVIAIVKAGSFLSSLFTIALAISYVLLMLKVVRPFLKRVGDLNASGENISQGVVAIFFLTLLISAYTTEIIGIHALFGAFMAGVIMPENPRFRNVFTEKVEDVAIVILLPLFFVFTGLRTEIGLLNDAYLWKMCGLIIAVAVTGKFFGSFIAAKFVGQSWKESLTVGALMNTRGLMELIVLNIGYDLGVLTPQIFAMLVIMALLTTFMTGPALDLINRIFKSANNNAGHDYEESGKYKVLVSFRTAERSLSLLRLANGLVNKQNEDALITVMHVSPVNELHHFNINEYERNIFKPIVAEAHRLNQHITTLFKPSNDIDADITEQANKGDFDLLLIGLGQSIFQGSLLGKVLGFTTRIINPERLLDKFTGKEKLFESSPFDERTRHIINNSQIPVGILIDKNLDSLAAVFIPVFHQEDSFLVQYAQRLITMANATITLSDISGEINTHAEMKEKIKLLEITNPGHIVLQSSKKIEKEFLEEQKLMIISLNSWRKLIQTKSTWLNNTPSVLIIKP